MATAGTAPLTPRLPPLSGLPTTGAAWNATVTDLCGTLAGRVVLSATEVAELGLPAAPAFEREPLDLRQLTTGVAICRRLTREAVTAAVGAWVLERRWRSETDRLAWLVALLLLTDDAPSAQDSAVGGPELHGLLTRLRAVARSTRRAQLATLRTLAALRRDEDAKVSLSVVARLQRALDAILEACERHHIEATPSMFETGAFARAWARAARAPVSASRSLPRPRVDTR